MYKPAGGSGGSSHLRGYRGGFRRSFSMSDVIHDTESRLATGTCRQGQRPSALPAGWSLCIPASCNMPVVPLPQRRSTRQVRLDTPERAAWLPTIIAASRNLGLQPTVSAHGRWRRRRTERPRLILEGMALLCSRCCQSPSRPSWSATVSATVLQFPFQGAAGAVARPQTRRWLENRRPGDSAGYELERAGAYEVQFITEEMST